MKEEKRVDAAVIVPVFSDQAHRIHKISDLKNLESFDLLFTVRSQDVAHHKGQISFPGGVKDLEDKNLELTALRELQEEVGIATEEVKILGELPAMPTFSSPFLVHPYVGLIHPATKINPAPTEVQAIFRVSTEHLKDPKHQKIEYFERNGLRFALNTYYFDEHRIWGATAKILERFLSLLSS